MEGFDALLTPNLNFLISSRDVKVVQVSCGGMHMIALTKNNEILTWGVNDYGALGRNTHFELQEDDDYNPLESTPGIVKTTHLGTDLTWSNVAACDNASFALTNDGRVYGWGTFRSKTGILGFNGNSLIQRTPTQLPDLKDIRQIATGDNHVLALDGKGKVFSWGDGEKSQLARRCINVEIGLRPTSIGKLPMRGAKISKVSCGAWHNFAIDQHGRVYGWGNNVYSQLGIPEHAGENGASELKPRLIESLRGHKIVNIAGGSHHSVACTDKGELLTWGRIDGFQVGFKHDTFTRHNAIFDYHDKPRILGVPRVQPNVPPIKSVSAGADHSLALTPDGKAYSWGYNDSGRTGQGHQDIVEVPTLIDCRAVRDRKLNFIGAGGDFSVVTSVDPWYFD
ncbi:regulator of chromosome condensation 1/beta-lactamase-inhibitor protein II, partial [Nemania sp. FL0916]